MQGLWKPWDNVPEFSLPNFNPPNLQTYNFIAQLNRQVWKRWLYRLFWSSLIWMALLVQSSPAIAAPPAPSTKAVPLPSTPTPMASPVPAPAESPVPVQSHFFNPSVFLKPNAHKEGLDKESLGKESLGKELMGKDLTGKEAPTAIVPALGERIFSANCSACHIGGNNVILSEKNLHKEALEKYAMASLAAIKQQVIQGKNAMPAFGDNLTSAEIEAVARYVLTQSEQGWKGSTADL